MIKVQRWGDVWGFRMARNMLGRDLYYTSAYWVDGIVIDTGCAYTAADFFSAIKPYPVKLIVNTHSHEDHIGANRTLQTRLGVEIKTHALGVPVLSESPGRKHLRPYQRIMWGYPDPSDATPLGERIETSRFNFEVIHTPGHSDDHICLYEPDQGWLFCGDAYVGGRDRALREDYNIWQILSSLKKMAALKITSLFPGSGTVHKHAGRLLEQKIDYLESTAERVLELHERGWVYAKIRQELFGKERLIFYLTLGHFSGRNLVRSFIEDLPRA